MPSTTAAWPRIQTSTIADRVYYAVRARILDGQLVPGQFVREKDLNEAMGVSRTPVREALGRLASEGFLERIPHRGFRIPDEPVGNLLELYPIVASLDLLAGRLALPRMGSDDIARLKETNARLREARTRGDVGALIELNNEFHHTFGRCSGNRFLEELLQDLRRRLARLELWYYSSSDHAQQSITEHDDIIQALEEGDHARALAILENNMSLTYTTLMEEVHLLSESS
jgi:DNA-binding GntR family transcriptional regulator